jgi:hypothetical protein
MTDLSTPDLCSELCVRLERLKGLCDRLEQAQDTPETYRELLDRIRFETDALRDIVCSTPPVPSR